MDSPVHGASTIATVNNLNRERLMTAFIWTLSSFAIRAFARNRYRADNTTNHTDRDETPSSYMLLVRLQPTVDLSSP